MQPVLNAAPTWEQGFSYQILNGSEHSTHKWWHSLDNQGGGVYSGSVARIDGSSAAPDPIVLYYFPNYIKLHDYQYITCHNSSYVFSPLGCTVYGSNDMTNYTQLGSITHTAGNNVTQTCPCSTDKFYRYIKVVYAHGSSNEVGLFEQYFHGTCLKYPPMYENAWAAQYSSSYYIKY